MEAEEEEEAEAAEKGGAARTAQAIIRDTLPQVSRDPDRWHSMSPSMSLNERLMSAP